MGNKHPNAGHVYIISEHNGYAIGLDESHSITTTKDKESRGISGWRIFNIPNDENIGRMGFNFIIHNKYSTKLLACDDNGNICISENKKWNSLTGWKIIQQKDTNSYQLICHNGYWLTMNNDKHIIMLKKQQLTNDKRQNWILQYISIETIQQNISKIEQQNDIKETESHNIEHKYIHEKRQIINHNNKDIKSQKNVVFEMDNDDGYDVDNESDDNDDNKVNYNENKMEHKKYNGYDKQFEYLNNTLISSMKDITDSIKLIRSEIGMLKMDMNKMEQKASIDRGRIKEKLDILQKSMLKTVNNNNNNNYVSNGQCSNKNKEEVKKWIMNSVGFGGYYNNFVRNGFDSLEIIKNINDPQQLNDIGIKLKGHQLHIMAEILQLKQTGNMCHYL